MGGRAPPPATGSSPASQEETGPSPIGVDPEFAGRASEADSAYDESVGEQSSTASVSSTILQYRILHGRTYHNYEGVEYWGPNDARQNEGLEIFHHMMYMAQGNKLFLAPLENPQTVLDIGTGTGIWAIDFADEFPSAAVTGTDVSPIQPAWIPPNCKFELDNCELDWPRKDNTLDYIHIRGMVGCVQDWVKLYREALRCLKPGGWLELQEFALPIEGNEGPLPDDCIWHRWGEVFKEAGKKMGRTFELPDFWEEWLREAGFTGELHKSSVRLPIGAWPADPRWKDVGIFNMLSLEQGLEGFATYVCINVLGWKPNEVTVLLARVRAGIRNRSYHAFFPLKTVYTQKPTA